MDLKFPHHENEIAQSCGAHGERFVHMWMHNGFVEVNAEKMSKSLGNFFTVREVTKVYWPDELHWLMVASHYRSPINYSDQELSGARACLTRLYTSLRGLNPAGDEEGADALIATLAKSPTAGASTRPCRMTSIQPVRWRCCLILRVRSTA